jgi:hypothetical protein
MLSQSLGLGVILDAKNMLSRQAQDAATSLNKVKMAAKGMGEEVQRQAEKANKEMERLKTGMKWSTAAMGAGAAILGTFGLMTKGAAETEAKLQDIRSLLAGKGMAPLAIDAAMKQIKTRIKEITSTYAIEKDKMEIATAGLVADLRSEERRVGKECTG